jgi:hypothetical protein
VQRVLKVEPAAPTEGWIAVAVPGRIAIVDPPHAAGELAERVMTALESSDGLQAALGELTNRGILAAPPFVLVEWSDDESARFIVRGGATVAVRTTDGERALSANGVSTWLEQPMSGVTGFAVRCGRSETAAELPLSYGAAWVGAVRSGATGAADAAGSADPAAAREQAVADASVSEHAAPNAPVTPNLPEGVASTFEEPEAAPEQEPEAAPEQEREPEPEAPEPIAEATVAELFEADNDAAEPQSGYDHLFGATVMRSVEEAAVRPDSEDDEDHPAEGAPTIALPTFVTDSNPLEAETAGDHDGMTVMSGDIGAMRAAAGATRTPPEAAPTEAIPVPHYYLQLPDGSRRDIDVVAIAGRAPSASAASSAGMPALITVDSIEHDISRSHVQFAIEGDTVVVTDLHSRNGTMIVLPGKSPQKLRAGEPTSVIPGTVVDLGSGVTLTVRQA